MVRNQVELNSPKGCVQLIKRFCAMQIPLAGFILFYVAVLHVFYIKHNTLKTFASITAFQLWWMHIKKPIKKQNAKKKNENSS